MCNETNNENGLTFPPHLNSALHVMHFNSKRLVPQPVTGNGYIMELTADHRQRATGLTRRWQ